MSISSLIVRVDPKRAQYVHDQIARIPHTEVTDRHEDAYVVLAKDPDPQAHRSAFTILSQTDGVINVDLVFHAFDDSCDPTEE